MAVAADAAAPSAGRSERAALAVVQVGERRFAARRDQGRVVELVTAHGRAGWSERAVGEKPRLAIAELELAGDEAGRMSEQSGHGMTHTIGVLESLAEHHVAAAFAVDCAGRGEARQP